MNNKKSVFISIGRPFNEDQEFFLTSLMELLRQNDLEPRVINKTDYPTGNPLADISRVMKECSGTIVVAYERTYYYSGVEKRSSQEEKRVGEIKYTTPWNQIEAAMAYALGMPILVLLESDVKEEGLLEGKYDWYVERVDITKSSLMKNSVRPRIEAWCKKVHACSAVAFHKLLHQDVKLKDLVGAMSVKTAWQIGIAVSVVFSVGLAVGRILKLN